MKKLFLAFMNWLFPAQDERKASTRYEQAYKIAREQNDLIQNQDGTY